VIFSGRIARERLGMACFGVQMNVFPCSPLFNRQTEPMQIGKRRAAQMPPDIAEETATMMRPLRFGARKPACSADLR
jgi:hypothetical protein